MLREDSAPATLIDAAPAPAVAAPAETRHDWRIGVDFDGRFIRGGPAGAAAAIYAARKGIRTGVAAERFGGQVLDTINLGPQTAGRHNFEWDASSYTGTANPTFKVTALQGTTAVGNTSLMRSPVESITTDAGAMNLTLKSGKTVAYDAIKAIL